MHCVDLGESFPTHIFLPNLASIQPRTSLVKFLVRKSFSIVVRQQAERLVGAANEPAAGASGSFANMLTTILQELRSTGFTLQPEALSAGAWAPPAWNMCWRFAAMFPRFAAKFGGRPPFPKPNPCLENNIQDDVL